MLNKKSLIRVVAELKAKKLFDIQDPQKMDAIALFYEIRKCAAENLAQLSKPAREVLSVAEEILAEDNFPSDLTSREAMNLAAVDMNEVIGLDPGIDTTLEDDLFFKWFAVGAKVAKSTDNLRDYTWKVLEALGMGPERYFKEPIRKVNYVTIEGQPVRNRPNRKPPKPKPEPKPKPAKVERPPSLAEAIRKFLDGVGSMEFSIDDIFNAVIQGFGDRDPVAVKRTIQREVPGRMTDAGYSFKKKKDSQLYTVKLPK